MTEAIQTLCPYCGVGCGLEVSPPAQPGKATNRDSQGNPIGKLEAIAPILLVKAKFVSKVVRLPNLSIKTALNTR